MKDDFSAILDHVTKRIRLTKAEAAFFTSVLEKRRIRKNEFLLCSGEVCKTENFIVSGCMRTYSLDDNGFEHIVMFGVEDWWVGDLYSFLTGSPSQYNVDALEDTEVLQISKENLDLLYDKVPKFERFFRLIIQNAFIAQQNRINQNLALTAEERYLDFVTRYPQFEKRIPQKHVAAYLGMTPVFLSMIRRRLAGKRLLK